MSKYLKIAEVAHEKYALNQPTKNFLGALATGAGLTLGGIGVAAGASAVSNWRANAASGGAFDAMVNTHPKLRMEDPKKVEQYFQTLWNFAPDIARDPLMAGGVITQAIRMDYTGAPPTELIKTVVEIQNKHRETKNKYSLPHKGPMSDFLFAAGQGRIGNSPWAENN